MSCLDSQSTLTGSTASVGEAGSGTSRCCVCPIVSSRSARVPFQFAVSAGVGSHDGGQVLLGVVPHDVQVIIGFSCASERLVHEVSVLTSTLDSVLVWESIMRLMPLFTAHFLTSQPFNWANENIGV